jgi:hypothetical protein
MSQHLPVQPTPEERQQLQGYTRRGVHHSRGFCLYNRSAECCPGSVCPVATS